MAKLKKKGTSGQARNFITRTQAVRKLQISLPDFRRLCIFKGIYPREPRNKKKAFKSSTPSTTFYYTKDIQYLLHEPLLQKFREQKALSKKIARSLGRNEVGDAARLEKQANPRLKLDHIIRERYPTFVDALRDLDDVLSLLSLFANLPSTTTVPAKTIARCQRLCHEFEHYLIKTHSLRKSFLSIKGIYYQATIQGQDILWLVPYKFVQRVTGDVDFRIMGTFVEFYSALLGFVNYRLYTTIGLVYPPKFNAESDERGGELDAFTIEGRQIGEDAKNEEQLPSTANGHPNAPGITQEEVQKIADRVMAEPAKQEPNQERDQENAEVEEEQINDEIDTFAPAAPGGDILPQPEMSSNQAGSLFASLTFFISREAPRHPLEFLLRAFGCERIGWDSVLGDGGFTDDESDPRITHQIVDRPLSSEAALPEIPQHVDVAIAESSGVVRKGSRFPGRTYIQPQWVWDCVNERCLLRPDLYAPGATLPPHLSPWTKPEKVRGSAPHITEYEEQARTAAADEERDEVAVEHSSDGEGEDDESMDGVDDRGMALAPSDSEDTEAEDVEEDEDDEDESKGFDEPSDAVRESPEVTDEAALEVADDADEEQVLYQKELEAEAAGRKFDHSAEKAALRKSQSARRAAKQLREQQEELEQRKMMMSRRKRKLYEKMVYSNNKKAAEEEKLRNKRRKIEKVKGKPSIEV